MTGYKGLDPEVSIKGLAPGVEGSGAGELYPTTRQFTVGLNLLILTLKKLQQCSKKTIYYWCIFSCYLFIQFLYQFG